MERNRWETHVMQVELHYFWILWIDTEYIRNLLFGISHSQSGLLIDSVWKLKYGQCVHVGYFKLSGKGFENMALGPVNLAKMFPFLHGDLPNIYFILQTSNTAIKGILQKHLWKVCKSSHRWSLLYIFICLQKLSHFPLGPNVCVLGFSFNLSFCTC